MHGIWTQVVFTLLAALSGSVGNALGTWSQREKEGRPQRPFSARRWLRSIGGRAAFIGSAVLIVQGVRAFNIAVPSTPWSLIGLLVAIIWIAALLFTLRTRYLGVYASVEFTVGVAAAWFAIEPLRVNGAVTIPHDPDRILKIIAAIYLMIRAMDNWSKAKEPLAITEKAIEPKVAT
jgi:hypothetical protein